MARSSILVLLADTLLAFVIVTTARRRRISERLMLGWLLVCALIGALAIWRRPGIDRLAAALDIYYAPSALFAIAFAGLLVVVYRLSVEIAEQKQRVRRLAQEIAVLTAKKPVDPGPAGTA